MIQMLFNRNSVSKLGWIQCRRCFLVINDNGMAFNREQRKPSASRLKTSYVACSILRVKLWMLEDNHQVFIRFCSLKKTFFRMYMKSKSLVINYLHIIYFVTHKKSICSVKLAKYGPYSPSNGWNGSGSSAIFWVDGL